jgi:hypothetical protein
VQAWARAPEVVPLPPLHKLPLHHVQRKPKEMYNDWEKNYSKFSMTYRRLQQSSPSALAGPLVRGEFLLFFFSFSRSQWFTFQGEEAWLFPN